MTKNTLSAHVQTAQEALRSLLKTLVQKELPLEAGAPEPSTPGDALREDLGTRFVLYDGARGVFVALSPNWVPLLSEGMLGAPVEAGADEAADLMQEIAAQGFGGIQTALAGNGLDLDAPDFTAAAPGEAPDVGEGDHWRVPFSVEHGGDTFDGFALLPRPEEAAPAKDASEAAPSQQPSGAAAGGSTGAPQQRASGQQRASAQPASGQRAPSEAEAVDVAPAAFEDLGAENLGGDGGGPGNFELLAEVDLEVTVELGRRRLPLADVLKLRTGSVVELEKLVGEPLSVYANGRLIAEGEAVVIDEQFGVRITGLASKNQREKAFF